MLTRRNFLLKSVLATSSLALANSSLLGLNSLELDFLQKQKAIMKNSKLNFKNKAGFGGVAAGNGFQINSNSKINETLQTAWDQGVRYYDTSPWYGLGLSERRIGHFLFEQKREDFLLSTKIGRILTPDDQFTPNDELLWKGKLNFNYQYDYTAEGTRKSIEDSLQRLGMSYLDIVYVHDLSPDNGDMGEKWTEYFEIAKNGAFKELSKLREEGIIKAWGMGVNTPEPILKCMEVADPDLMLVAIQYSLVEHKNALNNLFPIMEKNQVKAVIGGPLNAGFLAERNRFNYGGELPKDKLEKRDKILQIVKNYPVDLRTVALQFCAAHPVVASVIPGASNPEQALANAQSFDTKIPQELWQELKNAKLIEENAPV